MTKGLSQVTFTLDRNTIGHILAGAGVDAWGVACNDPALSLAPSLPIAVSIMMRVDPVVVESIVGGPTLQYLEEYHRLNTALDLAARTLTDALIAGGHSAAAVAATCDNDLDDPQVFPHKTAATQAGLGWIGKTALFVSSEFGPAVRLATVFTDVALEPGEPVTSSSCGDCDACLRACPAGAGRNVLWEAGMPRDLLFDALACHRQMAGGETPHDICGICFAACPRSRHRSMEHG